MPIATDITIDYEREFDWYELEPYAEYEEPEEEPEPECTCQLSGDRYDDRGCELHQAAESAPCAVSQYDGPCPF